ncbi:MAG TPA: 50S ribosomal protein L25 [Actinomycetota bacterium]
MSEVALSAEIRTQTGKGPARRLRAAGKVPATMYGAGAEPLSLAVDERALRQTLGTSAGLNVLIDLKVDGESHLALARELHKHPVRGSYVHIDFVVVDRYKPITADVPLHIEGESHGVKEGGVIEHHLWNVHVECLPTAVPDRLTVDISNLGIGDSVRVGDIPVTAGVTILTPADEIIASVVVPQVLKTEEEVVEEALGVAEGAPAEGEAAAGAPAEGEPTGEEG